jgi:hypothetical protein
MSRLPVEQLGAKANEIELGDAKAFHLPEWGSMSHPQRLAFMRQISMMRGRDPRIAKLAVSILRQYGAGPRQYDRQAAALLKWVQDPKNVYYVNEPGERLQDPIHTIKVGHGDCDDQVILLASLYESVGLPWRFVLSGRGKGGDKVRHIEGDQISPDVRWTHIYLCVGTPPFNPVRWYFAETTIVGVPLGWDVVSGDHSYLPEMFKPGIAPSAANRSPAYEEALADALGDVDAEIFLGALGETDEAAQRRDDRVSTTAVTAALTARPWWHDVRNVAYTAAAGAVAAEIALAVLRKWGPSLLPSLFPKRESAKR